MTVLTVLRAGSVLIQDLGRPGYAGIGVSRSGAADRGSLMFANARVGNPDDAAGLEILLGGVRLRTDGRVRIALAGAAVPVQVNGEPVANRVIDLAAGDELALRTATAGLRVYLAVAGGVAVPEVLGSRSTDTLSGIGPSPVRAGDVLPVGDAESDAAGTARPAVCAVDPSSGPGGSLAVELCVLAGPRFGHVVDPRQLAEREWTVSPSSSRVGIRLDGKPLGHSSSGVLPSEPMVRGAIQLPPSGLPVILGPDHPVTGGYPVVGVLTEESSDRLAQVRPGRTVQLRWV